MAALLVGIALPVSAHGPDSGTLLAWSPFGSKKSAEDPVNEKAKIVFASSALPEDSGAAKGMTSFNAGEPIYGRLYATETLEKAVGTYLHRRVFLDGQEIYDHSGTNLSAELRASKSLAFTLVPEPGSKVETAVKDDPIWVICAVTLAEKLTPGKHTVKVRFASNFPTEATFQLSVTSEGLATMRKMVADAKSAFYADRTAKVELPTAGMKDRALEADFIEGVKEDKYEGTPLKAIITSRDWEIGRHERTGVILGRGLRGVVAIKLPSGVCKIYHVGIQQSWDGAKYGKSRYWDLGAANSPSPMDIDCAKVK